ncbi:MAG TPA: DNA-3-methyladenine glycosylase 2 family protein [Alphaproteobacteria bacterium]
MFLKNHKAIRPSLEHLLKNDKHFKKFFTLDEIDAIPHTHRKVSFESFARTIVGQQLSVKAAATIWSRVELLADPFTPEKVLKVSDKDLRAAGLSFQKIKYLRGLSEAVAAKHFDPAKLKKLSDEEVIEAITALHGFGRWSAEMVLMFALARPDVFSGGDLGLREGIRRVLKLEERPTEKESVKLAERWAGHRTAASLLLWQANHKSMK